MTESVPESGSRRPRAPTSFPKERIKVLLLEGIHTSAHELFHAEGYSLEVLPGALKEDELAEKLQDVHLLGIRSKTQVTPRVLEHAKRLLALGCFCIGTNQVALRAAAERGVVVYNAPFSNTRSVAEMILCEVVMLARQLGDRLREMHVGKWRKTAAGSNEVRGKTLGIVGYGHIGRQVGVLAEALGMKVVFFDVAQKLPMGNNLALPSLAEVLRGSDFLTLHVPATPETEGMIGAEELAMMRPGAALLNASRGNVVEIAALAEALRAKRLGGAAVDVFPVEPESNSDGFTTELRELPNVILTPHIGGSTAEAQEAIGREVSTSVIRFVNSGATAGSVNFPQAELAHATGKHRILNTHRNVPGVLGAINRIVSEVGANIHGQVLATDADVGYLIMDLDQDVSDEVRTRIARLETSIKTRILY